MLTPWKAFFFGGFRLENGAGADAPITRFRSQKTVVLLAYLCQNSGGNRLRQHGREELADLLWPDADPEAGRNSLRVALSYLRRVLEPAGTAAGSVLVATRTHVYLRPEAISTDAAEFEAAIHAGDTATALSLYAAGPFLPGVYDEWALRERERLEALADKARHVDAARGPEVRPPTPTSPRAPHLPPALPNNLPLTADRFFGREEETARLELLLFHPGVRLVTLTGTGGTGKTRLALETVRRLLGRGSGWGKSGGPAATSARTRFPGGLWFVPLADIVSGGDRTGGLARALPGRLREAMGLPPAPPGGEAAADPYAFLDETLAGRPALLVLDNLEQVANVAPFLLTGLLDRLPQIKLLATSRARLGVPGERTIALAPLPLPEADSTAAVMAGNAAAALFVDRARAVETGFALTARNAGDIAALVRLLEGLPLAIELTAAWANVLSPGRMREQLEAALRAGERLDAFPARKRPGGDSSDDAEGAAPGRRGRHTREPRHRSLRAAFQWSYDLLPPDLQQLLAGLSVFRGGFGAEAASQVCLTTAGRAEAGLARLHQFSLITGRPVVNVSGDGGEDDIRFGMLESLREFAEPQRTPGERSQLAARHAAYFMEVAEKARPQHGTPAAAHALSLLERERANFYAALDWLQSAPSGQYLPDAGEKALRLASALHWLWCLRGPLEDGRQYLTAALAHASAQSPTKARADALNSLGGIALFRRDLTGARAAYAESRDLCQHLNYPEGKVAAVANLATVLMDGGEYAAAAPLFEEALVLARAAGHAAREAVILYNLGNLAHWQGDLPTAERFHAEARAIRQERGDRRGIALSSLSLGILRMEVGDFDAATDLLRDCLRRMREMGDGSHLDTTLESVARAEEGRERYERSAWLRSAAESIRRARQVGLPPVRQTELDRERAVLRERLGDAALATAWEAGAALSEEEAVSLALGEADT